ncbi:hypothetical protein AM587_10016921 [Phytophthora nicotianae]|uniref:Chromo domain-containing protein n=1 Tax=Phytophthora nicotianae TaxID=4792 RepID=A0A0W8C891_PHYNI|nr:hypothetical protein AM587_10016921 [Phytophthora nicotianae]
MSLDESSVLMDRALVTMCQDLPESLGLYNTAKDQFSLAAIRDIPLLENVDPDSRKLVLIRDWMRAYEPAEDQPLTSEITKSKTRNGERKRHVQLDSDDDVLSIDESSSSEDSSSESSSSSESDSDSRSRKKKKTPGNLPPKEVVLSSDEDEEPNDMFDTDDPDVYEVEKILRKKPGETYGDPDLYEVKWEGYDETTWEPASNISKDLIDEFEGQPVRENEYTVEEIVDRRSKRDPETRLKTHQYKVKWVGYDDVTWEPAENLPHNLRRKFDQKYESRKRRR